MAESKKILSKDIIDINLFIEQIKQSDMFSKSLIKTAESLKELQKINTDSLMLNASTAKDIKANTDAINQNKKAQEALAIIEKKRQDLNKEDLQLEAKLRAEKQLNSKALKQLVDLTKAEIILNDKQSGQLEKLNAENTILRINREKLIATDKNYALDLERINSLLNKNNAEIKENSDLQKQQKLNVGNYSGELRAMQKELQKLEPGTVAFNKLAKEAGDLKDKIIDAKDATKAFATESKPTQLKNIFGQIGSDLVDLDFKGASEKAKTFAEVAKSITFAELGASIKDLAGTLLNLGKVLLTSPIFLIAAAVAGIVYYVSLLYNEYQKFNDGVIAGNEEYAKGLKRIELLEDKRLRSAIKLRVAVGEISKERGEQLIRELDLTKEVGGLVDDLGKKYVENSIKFGVSAKYINDQQRKLRIDELERIKNTKELTFLGGGETQLVSKITPSQLIELRNLKGFDAEQNRLKNTFFIERKKIVETATNDEKIAVAESNKSKIAIEKKTINKQLEQKKTYNKEYIGLDQELNEWAEYNDNINRRRLEALNEIDKLNNNEKIKLLEQDLQAKKDARTKAQNDVLQFENLFGTKRNKQLDEINIAENDALTQLNNEKVSQLEAQMNKELDIKGQLEEEKQAITLKYSLQIEDIEKNSRDKKLALAIENLEFDKKNEIERTKVIINELSKVDKAIVDGLDKRSSAKQAQFDREINAQQAAINQQQQLAQQGQQNTLAEEQARLKQNQLAKQEALEKAQRQKEALQLADVFFNNLNAELSKPNANPSTATAKALAETLVAKGISKAFQFASTGNNMINGEGTTTSDSIPFMLSKQEAVIKASENIKHNDAVVALNAGIFDKMYMPKADAVQLPSVANNIYNSLLLQQLTENNKLLNEIANKPINTIDADKLGNIIETIHLRGQKNIITHKHKGC